MSDETKLEQVEAALDGSKVVTHRIGATRTIQTAVLVLAYLSHYFPQIAPHRIHYVFKDVSDKNGFWTADIMVDSYEYSKREEALIDSMVGICRAFVAGRGEIW